MYFVKFDPCSADFKLYANFNQGHQFYFTVTIDLKNDI